MLVTSIVLASNPAAVQCPNRSRPNNSHYKITAKLAGGGWVWSERTWLERAVALFPRDSILVVGLSVEFQPDQESVAITFAVTHRTDASELLAG